MRERLQKILAAAGVASRRDAEDLLRAGRVRVNGVVATLGERADPGADEITLDGRRVGAERLRYWMLHKPVGVLTATRDPHGRATVMDLVPELDVRVVPVGRLDRDTEGLVLLTNDGALAQALLHPSYGCEREYAVTVRGVPTAQTLARLASGVELRDGPTSPARVGRPLVAEDGRSTQFTLVLREGRKRQIRRSCAALGHAVLRLVRVRMGPIELGALPPRSARELDPGERARLLAHADALRRSRAAQRGALETAGAESPRTSDAPSSRERPSAAVSGSARPSAAVPGSARPSAARCARPPKL